ncbi:MAG TPA: hypothetical protein VGO62_07480 [Myxococcota bacterium]
MLAIGAVVALALIGVDGVLAACLTERDIPPPKPRALVIAVKLESDAAPVATCATKLETVEGPVPEGAVVMGTVATSTREKHASLAAHERAVQAKIAPLCADGLSVLSATETGAGVSGARMKLWRRPADAGPG